MSGFDQGVLEFQRTQNSASEIVFIVWVVHLLVALIAAIWIYRDARVRGKSGCAAAILMMVSILGYGLVASFMVICTWILIRPAIDASQRKIQGAVDVLASGQPLPKELPSDIVAAPSPDEYLKNLEQRHDSIEPPESSDTP